MIKFFLALSFITSLYAQNSVVISTTVDATAGTGTTAITCKFTPSLSNINPRGIGANCSINGQPFYTALIIPSSGASVTGGPNISEITITSGVNSIKGAFSATSATSNIAFTIMANTVSNTGTF